MISEYSDDELKRMSWNGDYLIVALKAPPEYGYYHELTERAFLVVNLINFMKQYPDIQPYQITVYELKEINESRPTL